uniref:Transmembrane protein n=2 Tax=Calcidiscus leptoporus TaxID=127549 RepID=A0A7S0INE9_9EUKA|eukprot:CAMPEP_0119352866 /NCGR_PEP_ID=MMETSP1334-20130426/2056_1 /TAXON_ID=127549 /ORGANISM="Calcidiscus leptoporus, Strain RCC1130" /LENGTH=222 /DNA_ID=CAMNT_0007365995 /DNA_START=140 /DNA_END=808 /DNA_ORIENTATION=+
MSCCANPNVSREVNRAKCAAVVSLILGIVGLVLGVPLGPLGILTVLAGLFDTIGGSMLVCCGPTQKGQGECIHCGAMVMFILSSILNGISFIVLIIVTSTMGAVAQSACANEALEGWVNKNDMPQLRNYDKEDCVKDKNKVMGALGTFAVFAILISVVCMGVKVWACVACCKARTAIQKEVQLLQQRAAAMPTATQMPVTVAMPVATVEGASVVVVPSRATA